MRKTLVLAAAMLMLTSCSGDADSSAKAANDITPASSAAEVTKNTQSTAPESGLSGTDTAPAESSSPEKDSAPGQSSTEEYPSEYELVINEPKAPQITSVSMKVKEPTGKSKLENAYGRDVLASGTVGLVGCPVKVTLCGGAGMLTFNLDKEALGSIPVENLAVLKAGDSFEKADYTLSEDTAVCLIRESGTYLLVDSYQWDSAWSKDPAGKEHETDFTVGEGFDFRITLPEGIAPNNISALWEKTYADGEHQIMTKELMSQNNQSEASVKAELKAYRYPGEEDGCDSPLPLKSFDDKISEISSISSDSFTLETSEPWDIGGGRRGFTAVFRFPGEPDKGIDEQTTVEAFYEFSEDTYILFALSFKGYDQTMTDNCLKSVKSFKYLK